MNLGNGYNHTLENSKRYLPKMTKTFGKYTQRYIQIYMYGIATVKTQRRKHLFHLMSSKFLTNTHFDNVTLQESKE